ncbi:M1 family aminopeptidase [Thermococcus sp.]
MLLLGADSAYEGYSRLFGTKLQKARIYLYPSKEALENITGKKDLWFVDYKKREIHAALIKDTGVYSLPNVDAALLEYAAGRKLPDFIAVGFGVVDAGSKPISPQEKIAKYVGIERIESLNLRENYNKILYAEAGDLLEYIGSRYGPRALIEALRNGSVPKIDGKEFMESAPSEQEETVEIGETILNLNISLEKRSFEGIVDYNNITSQTYVSLWRTPRLNVEGIKVNGEDVDFIQGLMLVIPLKDFKNGSVEIKYTGDYSTMEKIAPQRSHVEGRITGDMAFLRMEFLRPMLNSLELFHIIEIRVKADRGTVIGPGEEVAPGVWRIAFPHGFNGVIPVFVGEFRKMELMNGDLTVYYMGIGDKTAKRYANLTEAILSFGVRHFGKPGYRRVKVIYPKGINISSEMFDVLAYSYNPVRYKYDYSYEVAHWWVPGAVIFTENESQAWFSFAFPAYYSLKYAGSVSQEEYRALRSYYVSMYNRATDYGRKEVPLTEVWKLGGVDLALHYAVASYKGALVLEKLEEFTGKEALYKSLREFFEGYRFREGDLNKFVAILEKNSGKPVRELFQNLTTSTGFP